MPPLPGSPQTVSTRAPLLMLLFALFTGGGCLYWMLSDASPAWLSNFLPSSSYRALPQYQTADSAAVAAPDAAVAAPDAAVAVPDATVAAPDATVAAPDAAVAAPDAAVAVPDATVAAPDAAVAVPDATVAAPDAAVAAPDATVAAPDPAVAVAAGGGTAPQPRLPNGKGISHGGLSSVVEGVILPNQASPATLPGGGTRSPDAAPHQQDSMVGPALAEQLARSLAEQYWPEGSHPLARTGGVSTADPQWINQRFGSQLPGLSANPDDLGRERARALALLYMPSMIRGMYSLYREHFFSMLETSGLDQRRGAAREPLTNAQMAEMFALYGTMARGLAGCVRSYGNIPDIGPRIAAYAASMDAALAASGPFSADRQNGLDQEETGRHYQEAAQRRDREREELAETLRRAGAADLDAEDLAYAALWLYRRGESRPETLDALRSVFDDAAARLADLERRYRARPADAPARSPDR